MSGPPITMSVDEFKRFQAASAGKVEDSPTSEVAIRLVIWRSRQMRLAHYFLLAWAFLSILSGNLFSIPVALLFVISSWSYYHANKGIEELLVGLNAAGIIDTPTKETAFTKRARERAEKEGK